MMKRYLGGLISIFMISSLSFAMDCGDMQIGEPTKEIPVDTELLSKINSMSIENKKGKVELKFCFDDYEEYDVRVNEEDEFSFIIIYNLKKAGSLEDKTEVYSYYDPSHVFRDCKKGNGKEAFEAFCRYMKNKK